MAARGVVNTANAIESCPATVRHGHRAKAHSARRLSDAEVTALIEEIATLEAAAQRGIEARQS